LYAVIQLVSDRFGYSLPVAVWLERISSMAAIAETLSEYVCERNGVFSPHPFVVFVAIALPHFLYAYIWFKPESWTRLFPKNPVDAFATAGALGKCEYVSTAALQPPP
jgi:hypothetical protein